MNKILHGLYLGNHNDAHDTWQLGINGITHIVSVHENARPDLIGKQYLCVPISDVIDTDISSWFSTCNDFIHIARRNNGSVLVHCLAGVSRSATIVVAYLMTVTSMGWQDALRYVRTLRSVVNPNIGFQRQLKHFQHSGQLDQERTRFLRLYPPLKGSYDPHYHWRGADNEYHLMDHLLNRLTDVRVGPVEQAVQCACTVQPPPVHSHANNAADTSLPYNPWYGSYTEHMLQQLSMEDDDHVRRIRPVVVAAAKLLVHVEGERSNGDGLDRPSTAAAAAVSPQDEQTFDEHEERNLTIHTASTNPRKGFDATSTSETTEPAQPVHESPTTADNRSPSTGHQRSKPALPQRNSTTVRDGDFAVIKQTSKSVPTAESSAESSAETVGKSSRITAERDKSAETATETDSSPEYNRQVKYSLIEQHQLEKGRLAAKNPPNSEQSVSRYRSISLRYQNQPRNIITEQERVVESPERKFSLSDLIESMLNMLSPSHHQQMSEVQSVKEKARGEDGGAETASRSAADGAEETSKAVPDVFEDGSGSVRLSVDGRDLTAVVPDAAGGGNSSPRETVEDREVSMFMAGTGRQPEVVSSRPQLVEDTQTRNTAAERNDPNSEKRSYKQEDVSENQKERQDEMNVHHTADVSESASNQTTAGESFPVSLLNGNSTNTSQELGKDPMPQPEREEPPVRENAREIESETKPGATTPERPSAVAPVALPRTSVKGVSSKSLLTSDGNKADVQRSGEKSPAVNGEDVERVAADDFTVDNEFGVRGTETEEDMDVDDEDVAERGEDEPKATDAEIKGEGRSEEAMTSGATTRTSDDTEANSHRRQHQHQKPTEVNTEPTTLNEGRPTVSVTTTTNDANSSTLSVPAAPHPAHDTDDSSRQDLGQSPDHRFVNITPSSESPPTSRDPSSDTNKPTTEGTTLPEGESTARNANQLVSNNEVADTTGPDCKFPKSATGHRESEQTDRRARRLAKTIRIYHDLSTITTEYQENGNKAVTTIHLKSARNR